MPRLTEKTALKLAAPTTGQAYDWCSELRGFGVRVTANGVRSYIVQCRVNGTETRRTLGRVGTLSHHEAEDLARLALNAARRGNDVQATLGKSAAQTFTLQQVWDAYNAAGCPVQGSAAKIGKLKRQSTLDGDVSKWKLHISKLATKPVATITDDVVNLWCDGIVKQSGVNSRNQALLLLRALVTFAKSRGLCECPVITVKAGSSKRVQNYLSPAELKLVDAALIELAAEKPDAATGFNVVRVLLHTGARKSEILGLRRDLADLDNSTVRLEKDKASDEGRDILLSPKAVAILRAQPEVARNPHFFPGRENGEAMKECDWHFHAALKRAGVKRVRLHDLRHSFASAAISNGVELHTVGKLLGHRDYKATLRYAHLSDAAMRAGADKVAQALAA
jgi:integrase